jgi:cholesterol oxidase
MLGSMKYKKENPEDVVLKEVAQDMNREHTYGRVDYVGVYLGNPEKEETDPYFNGLGPKRKGCIECAGCMVGCRYNAKNTLDKNYLWFAENTFGAQVLPETQVDKIIPMEEGRGGYRVVTKSSTSFFRTNAGICRERNCGERWCVGYARSLAEAEVRSQNAPQSFR